MGWPLMVVSVVDGGRGEAGEGQWCVLKGRRGIRRDNMGTTGVGIA